MAGQTHLFFDNSADTIQVPLTHHAEGSHLPPQQHHIILERDESVTKRSQMTVSTQVWACMCVCCTLLTLPSETFAKCQSMT